MTIKPLQSTRWADDDSADGFVTPKRTARPKTAQPTTEALTVSTAFEALAVDPPPVMRQNANAPDITVDLTEEVDPPMPPPAPRRAPRRSKQAPFPLEGEAPKPSQSPPAKRRSRKQAALKTEAPTSSEP